jgi:hypothetical protein
MQEIVISHVAAVARKFTLLQGVIIPKHFLEYSALTGESANTTLGFC